MGQIHFLMEVPILVQGLRAYHFDQSMGTILPINLLALNPGVHLEAREKVTIVSLLGFKNLQFKYFCRIISGMLDIQSA